MSIKIRTFFLNSSYFLKSIWTSGNSFLKDPSSLMMIHPKSNCKQKLTTHFNLSHHKMSIYYNIISLAKFQHKRMISGSSMNYFLYSLYSCTTIFHFSCSSDNPAPLAASFLTIGWWPQLNFNFYVNLNSISKALKGDGKLRFSGQQRQFLRNLKSYTHGRKLFGVLWEKVWEFETIWPWPLSNG